MIINFPHLTLFYCFSAQSRYLHFQTPWEVSHFFKTSDCELEVLSHLLILELHTYSGLPELKLHPVKQDYKDSYSYCLACRAQQKLQEWNINDTKCCFAHCWNFQVPQSNLMCCDFYCFFHSNKQLIGCKQRCMFWFVTDKSCPQNDLIQEISCSQTLSFPFHCPS